jgi:hypothetical protein
VVSGISKGPKPFSNANDHASKPFSTSNVHVPSEEVEEVAHSNRPGGRQKSGAEAEQQSLLDGGGVALPKLKAQKRQGPKKSQPSKSLGFSYSF